ncbi:MAG: tryptophan synthase subunit alpha [Candidatus Peribacteraceae bacterium]|nr:tryptophan synthase subunit alpha [Candidatus Peribacteraceae bacterium]
MFPDSGSMIKLATHTVVGFPNLKASEKIVSLLAKHSKIVELQIPFSDPVADGKLITSANAVALEQGINPRKCLDFAKRITKKFPAVDFFFMSYFNPIFSFGLVKFAKAAKAAGVRGFIIPDLPVEEATELLKVCQQYKLQLVFVVSPNTPDARLKLIATKSGGWIYATARLGITGAKTSFGSALKKFINRIRKYSKAEIGVGFGAKSKKDLSAIRASGAEIGIIGSELFRQYQAGGLKSLAKFLTSLD